MEKSLSRFLANVLKNGTITEEQAWTFNQLETPHLQFAAVLALRKQPDISSCQENFFLPYLKTIMANTRWIEVGVLALALPLIHEFWGHAPEIKKPISTFAAAQPPVFFATMDAPKKHVFHPKNEHEALTHFMNEPLPAHTLDQPAPTLNEQSADDAESAALEALPITSRR